jgi:hypothetical protein
VKLGFHFSGDPATEKVRDDAKLILRGGHNFLDSFREKEPPIEVTVGGEAPVTPVSSPDSSPWTFPTNRAITFWRRCRGTLSLPSSTTYLW